MSTCWWQIRSNLFFFFSPLYCFFHSFCLLSIQFRNGLRSCNWNVFISHSELIKTFFSFCYSIRSKFQRFRIRNLMDIHVKCSIQWYDIKYKRLIWVWQRLCSFPSNRIVLNFEFASHRIIWRRKILLEFFDERAHRQQGPASFELSKCEGSKSKKSKSTVTKFIHRTNEFWHKV